MPAVEKSAVHATKRTVPPALIEAMTHAEFYPHHPSSVELRQTHVSYVLLAGKYVYKIKKPVRFRFIDSSTLGRRHNLCEEEVRLNRRLAPDVYLGVVPIVRAAAGFALREEGAPRKGPAVEYAVKMRRLPEDRMLDRMVREARVSSESIRALARRLAEFHSNASAAMSWVYGSADAVWRMVMGNLEETSRFAGQTVTEQELARLEVYGHTFIARNWELLNERARRRRVCEGHGDLRCDSVCLTDGLVIFDCLEFNERLRYGDVALDIAFLAMDFDRLGASALSREFIAAYCDAANDSAAADLVPFYKCYRATVRAKVESLATLDSEMSEEDHHSARTLARDYFDIACGYALGGSPAIIAVCGLSGTGKSTVACVLGDRLGFEVLNSDKIRKGLAGIPVDARSHAAYGAGIYNQSFNRSTYETMLAEAQDLLSKGRGVILDATFQRREDRLRALATATRSSVPVLFVECRAAENEVLRRLGERTGRTDEVSEATAEIYLRQREQFAALDEIAPESHLVLDTANLHPEDILTKVGTALEALRSRGQAMTQDRPEARRWDERRPLSN
jgi:uncharacterized protein